MTTTTPDEFRRAQRAAYAAYTAARRAQRAALLGEAE